MGEPIDWRKLEPEERNRFVAERVMGWQAEACDGSIGEQAISPDGWYCQKCGYEGWWGDDYDHEQLPPRYTQSMGLAWEVFRHMMSEHYPYRHTWPKNGYPPFWIFGEALLGELGHAYNEEIYPGHLIFPEIADWTPEKICLAALKAVGVEIVNADV